MSVSFAVSQRNRVETLVVQGGRVQHVSFEKVTERIVVGFLLDQTSHGSPFRASPLLHLPAPEFGMELRSPPPCVPPLFAITT